MSCGIQGYVMLVLVLILSIIAPARADRSADVSRYRSIDRINYGVIFNHVGSVQPTTGIWRHVFRVPLPHHAFGQVFTVSDRVELNGTWIRRSHCLREIDSDSSQHTNLCRKYLKHLRFLIQVGQGRRVLMVLLIVFA
jgi:hypothetical protein